MASPCFMPDYKLIIMENVLKHLPAMSVFFLQVGMKALVMPETFKTQNYYKMLAQICPEVEKSSVGKISSKTCVIFMHLFSLQLTGINENNMLLCPIHIMLYY